MMHFRIGQQRYIFQFKPRFFLFSLIISGLCCLLGDWQLHRYHYKQTLLAASQRNQAASPMPLKSVLQAKRPLADLQFQTVVVSGRYLNEMTMFVQNRMNQGRLGFEVLTPLQISGERQLLLVDRGWVPAPRPVIEKVLALQHITGDLKFYNEYQFILGKNILDSTQPLMMQKVDVAEISRVTHENFYPFVLRLGEQEPDGYTRTWIVTTVLPQRHMAYAVQWFALALLMLISFFCFCCERDKSVC